MLARVSVFRFLHTVLKRTQRFEEEWKMTRSQWAELWQDCEHAARLSRVLEEVCTNSFFAGSHA